MMITEKTLLELETRLQTAVDELQGADDPAGMTALRTLVEHPTMALAAPRLQAWILTTAFDRTGRANENLIGLADWNDGEVCQGLSAALGVARALPQREFGQRLVEAFSMNLVARHHVALALLAGGV